MQGILFAVNHLKNQNIVIFTDSLSALEIIQNPVNKGLNRLVNSILRQIYQLLTKSVKIVLQWIPSHKGIIGNNIVDHIAKTACSYETITHVPFEYKDLLKLVNGNFYTARLNYWNQIKNDLHFFKAVPNINQWEWVSMNNRRYDVLLARLRSGCVDLNNDLFTIKKRDNPFCDYCANDRETVEHYALHCQKYNDIRITLFNVIKALNTIDL